MTLPEAIQTVLSELRKPLTAIEIAHEINRRSLYKLDNNKLISKEHITTSIKEHSALFQNINGQIILVNDENWRELLKSYWYIANTLRGNFSISDFQFIIGALFFYKRLSDLSEISKGKVYMYPSAKVANLGSSRLPYGRD